MANKFNFTKTEIQKLPAPEKGMATYKDTKEKGLSLYVTKSGAKTFFIRKRINGRDERIILGAFPDISVENARKKALQAKAKVSEGKHPNEHKNKLRDEITFEELFREYMERYSKKNKRSWQYDNREIQKFLPYWFKRKISTIGQQDVRALHEKLREENGLYQANRMLERVRAIFNKAIEWGWDGKNPASGIKKYREKTRDRFIQPNEMPLLFNALGIEENTTARDYILMSLMTGARKSNVLSMRWQDINWERKEWRIPETKNGEPVTIPLTVQAINLLEERRQKTNSQWVFPSERNSGHFADPKKTWNRVRQRATLELWKQASSHKALIDDVEKDLKRKDKYKCTVVRIYNNVLKEAKAQGIVLPIGLMDIRLHDIRRTVGSYQAITGASLPIIGRSLGHKSQQATQIYARLNTDPIRASMERASEAIFNVGGNKSA
jgi:integrase